MHPLYILFLILLITFLGLSYYAVSPSLRSKSFRLSDREYLLHLPSGYKTDKKVPLVIALHAYTDHPRIMELYSGWSRKADKKNFIVVYPKGTNSKSNTNLSWNANFCCGAAVENNIDDVKFINDLINELTKIYSIDESKIYLTGYSNGGMLAYKIAEQYPGRFAGLGMVSTSPAGKSPNETIFTEFLPPTPPIRTIMLHGMMDESVPYKGGLTKNNDKEFVAFEDTEKKWQDSYHCEFDIQEVDLVPHVVNTRKYFCDDSLLLQSVSFNKSAHTWFGSVLEWKNLLQGNTLSATNLIWEFFEKGK